MVKFDSSAPGTTATTWTTSGRLDSVPPLHLKSIVGLAVVAVHPDDETLGAGGLIAEAGRLGIPLKVVIVTDGSACYPGSSMAVRELAALRSHEVRKAVGLLAPAASIQELGFPDGETKDHRESIAMALAEAIPDTFVIASPWRGDGHRDHRIVGEVCASLAVARRVQLLEFPIWMWHWSLPDEETIPWADARELRLSPATVDDKRAALACHASQVFGLGVEPVVAPLLTEEFLTHFVRGQEYFFATEPLAEHTKTAAYFDALYEGNSDPWRLSTRWYETRKRAISAASLPRHRYLSALEIGCSVGELTALIAERADSLLALDISQAAVSTARARTSALANVSIERRDATRDFPDGAFDLIVLSEVAYYWDESTLRAMISQIVGALATDGTVLACHWRHPVADYPLRGDVVHAALNETPELHRIVRHEEEDFILEVFGTTGSSVARREGLLG